MKNLFDIQGKVAIVTGGSRGIGAMIAQGFVENGVKVYISARKANEVEDAAKKFNEIGECVPVVADLSTKDGRQALLDAVSEEKVDILVNNAGATWGAPFDEFPEEAWDKVMDINVKSVFYLTQMFTPKLKAAGTAEIPARVINIASVDGIHVPTLETYPYSASKAGVIHMTKVLAKRLVGDHINVNAIAPGPFESKMMAATLKNFGDALAQSIPRKRIGESEDMAGTAIFLSSQASAYITGVTIPVDGGMVSCR
jgi:NAD(P)-dependent dehydrogenase (short-subunit alcohol dehydrogenase family)